MKWHEECKDCGSNGQCYFQNCNNAQACLHVQDAELEKVFKDEGEIKKIMMKDHISFTFEEAQKDAKKLLKLKKEGKMSDLPNWFYSSKTRRWSKVYSCCGMSCKELLKMKYR